MQAVETLTEASRAQLPLTEQPSRISFVLKVSSILTAASALLWAISIAQTKLVLDDWGLIHSLPITFFLALALLTMSSAILWFSSNNHSRLLGPQLMLFISMLWLTPPLLGTTLQTTRVTYGLLNLTDYITRFGYLDPATQWYHNWPAFNLIETALVYFLGASSSDLLLTLAPFVMQLLVFFPLYLFLSALLPRTNHRWAAAWLYFLFSYSGQTHFTPQGVALIFMLMVFAFMVKAVSGAWTLGSNHVRLIVLALVGLTMTHELTALITLFVLGTVCVLRLRRLTPLVMLLAVFIGAWDLYEATSYFNAQLAPLLARAFRLDILWYSNIGRNVVTGSDGHLQVARIRIIYSALIGVLAVAGVAVSWWIGTGTDRGADPEWLGWIGRTIRRTKAWWHRSSGTDRLAIELGLGVLVSLPFAFYGGEIFTRTYTFLLPVMAYFGSKLLLSRKLAVVLVAALVAAGPLSVVAFHGNEAMENISGSQRDYWSFLESMTTTGRMVGGGMTWGWTLTYQGQKEYDPSLQPTELPQAYVWRSDVFAGRWPPKDGLYYYLGLSNFEIAQYSVGYGQPHFVDELRTWLEQSPSYDRVFTNGEVSTYLNEQR